MPGEIDVRFDSDPRRLRFARQFVEACCEEFELQGAAARDLVQAVGEAVSNVMRHAYGGDPTRPVRLVCRRAAGALEVEVCDHGIGFDPFAQPVPPPDELRSGGRGLFLIRELVDACEYERVDGWNCLRLRKRWEPQSAGRTGEARREA